MAENIFRLVPKTEKIDEERLSSTQELISWLTENQENVKNFVFIGITNNNQTDKESMHVACCHISKIELVYLLYIMNKWVDMVVMSPEDDA